ncbi:MAG: caspase family protein, partial [Gemmataceae bacterium]
MTKSKTTWMVAALLLGLVLTAQARSAEAEPQTYIVLVGIDKYADPQIKPRAFAEADAKALYDLFTDKQYLGADAAHIRLLLGSEDKGRNAEKATHENILKALKWLADKAEKQDTVILGLFLQGAPKGESSCYFATDSTYKDRAKNAVSGAEIEAQMERLKSQKFCALVDVNFKGFDSGKETAPNLNLANLYKVYLGDAEKGTNVGRILFLANSGTKPSLETKDHGLFADVLLTALKGGADKEGYEPDGLVTIDELTEYLENTFPGKVREIAKTAEEKEQGYHVLGGRSSHFELTHNPEVSAKMKERLEKFEKLAKDKNLPANVVEEGKQFLARMPKLEAQRNLRKQYQALVDGKVDVAGFNRERDKILESTKFNREDALAFAAKIIQATQQVKEDYVKELNQGEMVGWGIKGLYRRIDEPIPQDIKDRLDKIKKLNEKELTELLADVRQKLGKREDLDEHKDIDYTLQRMLSNLDPYTTYIDPATLQRFQQETDASFTGIG